MKRTMTIFVLALFALLTSGCGDISTSGNYTLESGRTLRGDFLTTEGVVTLKEGSRVTGNVIMTSGQLRVETDAIIGGSVVMFSGELYLESGSIVRGNVIRTSGDIHQEEGALIQGQVSSNIAGFIAAYLVRLVGLYCVLPLVFLGVVIGAVVFFVRRGRRRHMVEAPAPPQEPLQKLKQLKAMLDDGLISEEEYEAKKAEILSKV
jgi:hypothetical protein